MKLEIPKDVAETLAENKPTPKELDDQMALLQYLGKTCFIQTLSFICAS